MSEPEVCDNCGKPSTTRLWLTRDGRYLCATCSTQQPKKLTKTTTVVYIPQRCTCFIIMGILIALTYSTTFIWLGPGFQGLIVIIILIIGVISLAIEEYLLRQKKPTTRLR